MNVVWSVCDIRKVIVSALRSKAMCLGRYWLIRIPSPPLGHPYSPLVLSRTLNPIRNLGVFEKFNDSKYSINSIQSI